MSQGLAGRAAPFAQTWFHGTKADLAIGDTISAGHTSNFGEHKTAKYVFFTATLDAAIWGAELARGEGRQRIFLVEAQGEFEDDPDLTNRRFPGNPTRSFRSTHPLLIVGEVSGWRSHESAQIATMKAHLEQLRAQGVNSLNDEAAADGQGHPSGQ